MKTNRVIEDSIFIFVIKKILEEYNHFERRVGGLYRDSRIYVTSKETWEKMAICFKYSFLGRITEINDRDNTIVLHDSKVVQWGIKFCKRILDKFNFYLKTSEIKIAGNNVKSEFIILPVRTIGMVLITGIAANAILSILFQGEISAFGWFMRGLFLFAGIAGLFCDADWEIIKGNSLFLKKIGV